MSNRCRNVCFTSYISDMKISVDPNIRYYCMQQEKCPNTGKLHWQGYIEFFKPMRYNAIKDILGDKAVHLEKRRGTAVQASDYCKKVESSVPNTLVEFGSMSNQGERIDIYEAVDDIRHGHNTEAHDVYLMRYPRGYMAVKEKYDLPPRRDDIKIVYIYGPSGTGKTRYAWQTYPEAYGMRDYGTVWLDQYKGEKVIIVDEFVGNTPIRDMLQLCDRYPLRLPVKGGHVSVHASTIVITSNAHPEQVYSNTTQNDAWLRRLKEFGSVIKYPLTGA